MASSSINNIAAAFSSSSRSSSPPHDHHHQRTTAGAVSWNPHSSLPLRLRSSLLSLYGPPGPLRPCGPLRTTTTPTRPSLTLISSSSSSPTLRIIRGPHMQLPSTTLSFLTRPDHDHDHLSLQTTTLPHLTRGKKSLILSVTAAFAPPPLSACPRRLVAKTPALRRKYGVEVVAIVAANDVYVMRAWGESMGVDEAGVVMLSDVDAELASAMGVAVDMRGSEEGLGVRGDSFCMVVVDGVVKKAVGVAANSCLDQLDGLFN